MATLARLAAMLLIGAGIVTMIATTIAYLFRKRPPKPPKYENIRVKLFHRDKPLTWKLAIADALARKRNTEKDVDIVLGWDDKSTAENAESMVSIVWRD